MICTKKYIGRDLGQGISISLSLVRPDGKKNVAILTLTKVKVITLRVKNGQTLWVCGGVSIGWAQCL